jgi:hypothetical protein
MRYSIFVNDKDVDNVVEKFKMLTQGKHLPKFVLSEKDPEKNKTYSLALAKFSYNCWHAQKTFSIKDKTEHKNLLFLLNNILQKIPQLAGAENFKKKTQPFESQNFYPTNIFESQFSEVKFKDDQKVALFFSEVGIYCEAAKKTTVSSASQESIDQFLDAANSEKSVPEFWSKVSLQFCVAGDPVLMKLQHLIKIACIPFHSSKTNLNTALGEVDVIGNRLRLVLDAIIQHFEDVSTYCWVGRDVLNHTLMMITPISKDGKKVGIEDPAKAIKELRERRKEFNFITRRFSFAADALMNAINWIVDPYVHSSDFTKEQLKRFAALFAEMPYSSRLWKDAYKRLISKFGDLETADKIKVIEAAKNREVKRKEIDSAIPNLILRTSTHQNSNEDRALTEITQEHNIHLRKYFSSKRELRVPQSREKIPEELSVFSKQESLFESNKKKLGEMLLSVNREIGQALREDFDENNIPNDLEKRIQVLEEKIKSLPPSDYRHALQFVLDRGKLALELERKRNETLSCDEGKVFYNRLLYSLTITLSAARTITSGMVGRRNAKTFIAGTAVRFLGEVLSLPIISGIVSKLGEGIEFFGEYKVAHDAQALSGLTNTNSELELLAEKITLGLAEALKEKLRLYNSESVKKIAEYCKERFKTLLLECEARSDRNNIDATALHYIAKILEPYKPEGLLESIHDYFICKLEPKKELRFEVPKSIEELWKFQVPNNQRAVERSSKGKEELSGDRSPSKGAYLPLTVRNLDRSSSVHGQHIKDIIDVMDAQANRLRELEDRFISVAQIAHIQASQTDELEKLIQTQSVKILELKHEIISSQLNELKHAKQMIKSLSPERSPEPTPFNTPVKNATPSHLPLSPYAQRLIGNLDGANEEEILRRLKAEKRALKNDGAGIRVGIYAQQNRSTLPPYKRTDSIAKRISQEQYVEGVGMEEIEPQEEIKKLKAYYLLEEFFAVQKRFSVGLILLADTFEKNSEKIRSLLDAQNFQYVMGIIKQIRGACYNPFEGLGGEINENNFDKALHEAYDIFSSEKFNERNGKFLLVSENVAILRGILGAEKTKKEIKKLLNEQKSADDYFMSIIQHFPRIELLFIGLETACKEEFETDLRVGKRVAAIEKIMGLASTFNRQINEKQRVNTATSASPSSFFSRKEDKGKNEENASSRRRALTFGAEASQ